MRWMKRLAAGVLAAGMALALLTACGSSKNNSVAPPVPITPPKTEAPNETITGHNVGGQYRYLQYRVVGTSGMGELKYVVTNGSDGDTYVGNDDKGVIISYWSRNTDYRVDNTATKIEGWVVGNDMDSVIPERYRTPRPVYSKLRYSSYTGYSA